MLAITKEHLFSLPRHIPGAPRMPSSAAPEHHTATLRKACSPGSGWHGTPAGKEESLPWGGRLFLLLVSDRGVSCLRQPYHSGPGVVRDWSRIRDYLEDDEISGLAGAAIADSPKLCAGLPQGRTRNMLETARREKGTLEGGVGQ